MGMTQDDIVVMAVNAGLVKWEVLAYKNELERFAKLVADKEQDRICRQIAALHDSIMLASHATLTKRGEA